MSTVSSANKRGTTDRWGRRSTTRRHPTPHRAITPAAHPAADPLRSPPPARPPTHPAARGLSLQRPARPEVPAPPHSYVEDALAHAIDRLESRPGEVVSPRPTAKHFGPRSSIVATPSQLSMPVAANAADPVLRRPESVLMEAARVRPSRRSRMGRILLLAAVCSVAGGMAAYHFLDWQPTWPPAALSSVFAFQTTKAVPMPPTDEIPPTIGVQPPPPSVEAPRPTEAPAAAPPALTPTVVKLTRPSALYVRPNPQSTRATRLPTGQVVRTYPAFDAPKGWVLGQSEKGTVGFISTRHIAGRPDPAIDRPRRRASRRRRSTP